MMNVNPITAPPSSPSILARERMRKLVPLALALLTLAAYANSFTGAFVYDDLGCIVDNQDIRTLSPISKVFSGGQLARPVLFLSMAINYAFGEYDVIGYHFANLAIHILAGLVLMGIVRRTLTSPRLAGRFARRADLLAAIVAALWLLHPLQTNAVTYIIQRAESMMSLFFLLTLYALIRAVSAPRPAAWYAAAVVSFGLSLGTKQVAVAAPLVVLIYDRVFLADSFRSILRRRWGLYLGLLAVLAALLAVELPASWGAGSAGVVEDMSPWQYARTQPRVILYYLRLVVWPHPLVIDYLWPAASTVGEILPAAVIVAALVSATVWALRRRPALGFLGAWFFLILAPTSTIMPIRDVIFEHRMYLPLAACVALAVIGGYGAAAALADRRRLSESRRRGAAIASLSLTATALVALGAATFIRNQDYQSEITLWADTVLKSPHDPRAYNNLGYALEYRGRLTEAVKNYQESVRLRPEFLLARENLGAALAQLGRHEEAVEQFRQAMEVNPKAGTVQVKLAQSLWALGRHEDSLTAWRHAVQLAPDRPETQGGLGKALLTLGRHREAVGPLEEVVRLRPQDAPGYVNLGNALAAAGQGELAESRYAEARRLRPGLRNPAGIETNLEDPSDANDQRILQCRANVLKNPGDGVAHHDLATALAVAGRYNDAVVSYREAIRLKPDYPEAHNNLGNVLHLLGRHQEALAEYQQAVKLRPAYPPALNNMGAALNALGRSREALGCFREVLTLQPNYPDACRNLASTLVSLGRFGESIAFFDEALLMAPAYAKAYHGRATAYFHLQEYDKAWNDIQACRANGGTPNPTLVEQVTAALRRRE